MSSNQGCQVHHNCPISVSQKFVLNFRIRIEGPEIYDRLILISRTGQSIEQAIFQHKTAWSQYKQSIIVKDMTILDVGENWPYRSRRNKIHCYGTSEAVFIISRIFNLFDPGLVLRILKCLILIYGQSISIKKCSMKSFFCEVIYGSFRLPEFSFTTVRLTFKIRVFSMSNPIQNQVL